MTLPGWRDWAFALKTCAAAMLALFLALWIDLPRPYWAVGTVYITSQVLSGATRSKAIYRVCGTVLGAAISVVLVPNLVNAPVLLSLAIALWVALCLYVALLDRTPASYLPMLAGYTAALIGFPAVDAPGTIFDTAVARAEEISLGIVCAGLAATLVLPQSAAPVIALRLDLWLAEARAWTLAALNGALSTPQTGADNQARRLRLASDAIALDGLGLALRNEATGAGRAAAGFAPLRQHMLMVLPIVAALADRVQALDRAGALPARVRALLSDIALWLASEGDGHAEAERLRARIDAVEPSLGRTPGWDALLLASLAARLRDVIDLRGDLRMLRDHLVADTPPAPLAFTYTARVRHVRHRDHGLAALSAFGAFASILVCCAIWIATGWPDGSAAPMMAAVTCCLFAALDDPAQPILDFANSAIVGAMAAGFYLFAVLPVVTTFEMLALALAPALILCGLMMTQPRLMPMGMGAAVNGATLIALQNGYSGDFAPFANSVLASVAGMWIAALVIRLVRSLGAGRIARRLLRINRASLAAEAAGGGAGHGLELAALMLDRVGLIAPRLAAIPAEDAEAASDLLADVRIGINLVEVRRVRRRLSGAARVDIDGLLALVARQMRSRTAKPGPDLLAALDTSLDAVAEAADSPERKAALIGLTGLRRGLFPAAPAYRAPHPQEIAA